MFASTFRTQARLALTSCRARVSMVSASRTMLQPRAVPTLSTSRALSTSRPLWDFGSPDAAPARGNQPKNILFVGNMPYSVEEREIREKFEPFGEIQSIRIAYRPDGASRGFAHVEFVNEADAAAAVESTTEEPVYMLDRDLRVSFAERKPRPTETRTPTHSLYFHGLRADPEVLRNATRPFENSIINLFFLKDRETGKETGAGFIHFMSVERATEALHELNGLDLGGNETLFLRYAYPKKTDDGDRGSGDRRGGSGRPSRGGFGGGGGDRSDSYGGGNRRGGGYGGGGSRQSDW